MKKCSVFIPLLFISLIISVLISCAVNPVTGKRELMLLSEDDEIQLGIQTDEQIIQTYGLYDDPELLEYISEIGKRLVKLSHRPHLEFHFRLLDTPVINAFAVPGGYIYITRGILAYLNSEAEFAGVLGHEIGHVTARHSAKQYTRAQLAQLGLNVGMVLSDTFQKYAGLAQFGVGMLFLRFSRDNERQADQLGVEYSSKAGYDATQMANFFINLQRVNPEADRSGLPGWFSTHPSPTDRVNSIKRLAAEWKQKLGRQNFEVDREEYLQKIDGLVFGEDPRQGFVEGGTFYHPTLAFQFPVPDKWKVINTPTQVQMVSPDEDAVIIFGLSTTSSPGEAAVQFLEKSKATVLTRKNVTVNRLPAYQIVSELTSPEGSFRLLSYFIQKDDNIFVFHGLTDPQRFEQYQRYFQSTMTQFRKLTDSTKLNIQPDRIRIKKVSHSAALQDVLRSFGIPEKDWETISILNGKKLTDMVQRNSLIKIIELGR